MLLGLVLLKHSRYEVRVKPSPIAETIARQDLLDLSHEISPEPRRCRHDEATLTTVKNFFWNVAGGEFLEKIFSGVSLNPKMVRNHGGILNKVFV